MTFLFTQYWRHTTPICRENCSPTWLENWCLHQHLRTWVDHAEGPDFNPNPGASPFNFLITLSDFFRKSPKCSKKRQKRRTVVDQNPKLSGNADGKSFGGKFKLILLLLCNLDRVAAVVQQRRHPSNYRPNHQVIIFFRWRFKENAVVFDVTFKVTSVRPSLSLDCFQWLIAFPGDVLTRSWSGLTPDVRSPTSSSAGVWLPTCSCWTLPMERNSWGEMLRQCH